MAFSLSCLSGVMLGEFIHGTETLDFVFLGMIYFPFFNTVDYDKPLSRIPYEALVSFQRFSPLKNTSLHFAPVGTGFQRGLSQVWESWFAQIAHMCMQIYVYHCVCIYIWYVYIYIYTVYLHTHPHPLKSMEDLGQVTTRKGMLDSTFSRPTIITTDWFITRNGLKVSEALWDPLFLNQILLQINPLEKG